MSRENKTKDISTQLDKLSSSSEQDKAQQYKILISYMVSANDSTKTFFHNNISKILGIISKDFENSTHHATTIEALNLLMQIVENDSFIDSVDTSVIKGIVKSLIKILCNSNDRNICSRSLICLSRGKYPNVIIMEEVSNILSALKRINQTESFRSTVIDRETLILLNNVFTCDPSSIRNIESFWFNVVHQMLFHDSGKVREKAYHALKTIRALFVQSNSQDVLSKLYLECFQSNDNNILKWKEIVHVTTEESEIDLIFNIWMLVISVLGRELHNNLKIVNQLMPVMEKGFERMAIKHKAFNSWKALIENFALDHDGLCKKKRLKLLLTPFLTDIAKSELVVEAKLKSWWFLICRMGSGVGESTEEVLIPFLTFCFGISGDGNLSGKDSTKGYPSSLLLATECLSQILPLHSSYIYSVSAPFSPIINSQTVFVKYQKHLLEAVKFAIQFELAKSAPKINLLQNVWVGLVLQCKSILEVEMHRKTAICVVHELLKTTEYMSLLELETDESRGFIVEMIFQLQKVLSYKVLSSTAFGYGNIMNGTPASCLAVIMVSKNCLDSSLLLEQKYLTLFQSLLSLAITAPGFTLPFFQSIVEHLKKACQQVSDLNVNDSRLSVFYNVTSQIWLKLADGLLEQLKITQEVNQGDNLEHDFTCCYETLLFPIEYVINNHVVTQNSKKVVVKLWCDLYKLFFAVGSLITTVENNAILEVICKKMLDIVSNMKEICPLSMEHLTSILKNVAIAADLKLFDQPKRYSNSKKVESLKLGGNISSLVYLIKLMIPRLFNVSSNDSLPSVTSAVINILDVVKSVYSRVCEKQKIQFLTVELSQPLSLLYTRQNISDFGPIYKERLETVWNSIISALTNHYLYAPTNVLLTAITPLLINCFACPKPIITKARILWQTLFHNLITSLTVPEALQACLRDLKPPLMSPVATEDINNTVDDSQSDSLSLNGDVDPPLNAYGKFLLELGNSPKTEKIDKNKTPPPKTKAKSNLADLPEEEFVVVTSGKKKSVLTEHQKEIMKEKRTSIPALYNDLSQDSNAMIIDENSQTQDLIKTVGQNMTEENDKNVVSNTETVSQDEKEALKDSDDLFSSEITALGDSKSIIKKPSQGQKRKSEIHYLTSDSLGALFGPSKKKKLIDAQGNFSRLVSLRCRRNPDSCVERKKYNRRLNYDSIKNLGRKSLRFRKLIPESRMKKAKKLKVESQVGGKLKGLGEGSKAVDLLDSTKEETLSDEVNISVDLTPAHDEKPPSQTESTTRQLRDETDSNDPFKNKQSNSQEPSDSFPESKDPSPKLIDIHMDNSETDKPIDSNYEPIEIRQSEENLVSLSETSVPDVNLNKSESPQYEQTAKFDLSSLGLVRVSDMVMRNSMLNKSQRPHKLRSNTLRAAKLLKQTQIDQDGGLVSPSSILKRKEEKELDESSAGKRRQVHFADPPVSGEREIPVKAVKITKTSPSNSALILKSFSRVQPVSKGITMDNGNKDELDLGVVDSVGPIFPPLTECKDSVENIIPLLTSSSWTTGILQLMRSKNLNTVGDLCKLNEAQVKRLLITQPGKVRQVLVKYLEKVDRRAKVTQYKEIDGCENTSTESDPVSDGPIDKIIKSFSNNSDSSKHVFLEQLKAAKKFKTSHYLDDIKTKAANDDNVMNKLLDVQHALRLLEPHDRCTVFLDSFDSVEEVLVTLLNLCRFQDIRKGLDSVVSKHLLEISKWWDETLTNQSLEFTGNLNSAVPLTKDGMDKLSLFLKNLPKSQLLDLFKTVPDHERLKGQLFPMNKASRVFENTDTNSLLKLICDRVDNGIVSSCILENISRDSLIDYIMTDKQLQGMILKKVGSELCNQKFC